MATIPTLNSATVPSGDRATRHLTLQTVFFKDLSLKLMHGMVVWVTIRGLKKNKLGHSLLFDKDKIYPLLLIVIISISSTVIGF